MIEDGQGNLLKADAEAVVNTVNCFGFMGKGIALQFKQAYPDNFYAYERAVHDGLIKPGSMFVFETNSYLNPKFIINFPTKRHWRGKSRLEDIKSGLVSLVEDIKIRNIKSIAVPPLGCGNGGLDWKVVRPLTTKALAPLSNVDVFLYSPGKAPEAISMPIATAPANMTAARALFVKAIEQYTQLAYRLTLLEIQKIAYFLQEAGEPLKLRYEAGLFGPYAANLNKVLERIEGHFIRGYGDSQKPDTEIRLLEGAIEKADAFLEHSPETKERLEKVTALISGFETPYGMELLSSVHWVAKRGIPPAQSAEQAVEQVHAWNERKKRMFLATHIARAWQRLAEEQWL